MQMIKILFFLVVIFLNTSQNCYSDEELFSALFEYNESKSKDNKENISEFSSSILGSRVVDVIPILGKYGINISKVKKALYGIDTNLMFINADSETISLVKITFGKSVQRKNVFKVSIDNVQNANDSFQEKNILFSSVVVSGEKTTINNNNVKFEFELIQHYDSNKNLIYYITIENLKQNIKQLSYNGKLECDVPVTLKNDDVSSEDKSLYRLKISFVDVEDSIERKLAFDYDHTLKNHYIKMINEEIIGDHKNNDTHKDPFVEPKK